jgi:hypothetical protein
MKMYCERRGSSTHFLPLKITQVALPDGKWPRYPLDRHMSEPSVGLDTMQKKEISSPIRNQPQFLRYLPCNLITILTELPKPCVYSYSSIGRIIYGVHCIRVCVTLIKLCEFAVMPLLHGKQKMQYIGGHICQFVHPFPTETRWTNFVQISSVPYAIYSHPKLMLNFLLPGGAAELSRYSGWLRVRRPEGRS